MGARKAYGGALAGAALTASGAVLFAVSITALPVYYGGGGNVETVLLARYALILAFCYAVVALKRMSLRLGNAELAAAMGSGVVFGAGGLLAIATYAYLPVSLGVLIFYLFPLFTVLMEAPLDRRMPQLPQIACLLAALGGIALALEVGSVAYDVRGIVLAVLGAAGVAASFVWSGRSLGRADPMVVNVYRSACALGLAAGFGLASGHGPGVVLDAVGWTALVVAVLASVAAFVAMFAGVQRIGATPAAMIMNLEPVSSMALAAIVLSEAMTLPKLAGAALIIGAILVSQWLQARGRRPRRAGGELPRGPLPAAQRQPDPAHAAPGPLPASLRPAPGRCRPCADLPRDDSSSASVPGGCAPRPQYDRGRPSTCSAR